MTQSGHRINGDLPVIETQDIPWKRLSVEAAAIVASILLAFAIDAWWDEREERRYEQETLLGLESEYEGHRKTIDRQIRMHRAMLGGVGNLMKACQSGAYTASDLSLDDALYRLQVPITTDLGSGVRDSLISAGRIEVLSNRELRYALSAWDSVLDEVTDGQMFSLDLVRESFVPLLAEKGIAVGHGMHDKEPNPWPVTTRPISSFADMEAQLFADKTFCTMLNFRYTNMNHTLTEYEDLSKAIMDVLALIRDSLAEAAS
ncbi:MAG: hypothetical protein ACI88G_000337 [Woeseiaceae bacterium]